MFDVLYTLSELQTLSPEQRQSIYRTMPKTAGECRIYSIMFLSNLWDRMIDDEEASLILFCRNLHEWYKARKFDKMYMYLIMCQCAYCTEVPPFLLEFSLYDELLEMIMGEIMRQAEGFCERLDSEDCICPACLREIMSGRIQQ